MKIANRYEVIKEIGSGGMAVVYLALDTILKREVAIKLLKGESADDPVALERFKREANTLTKLSHPNAVDIYDVGDDGNNHYIVMEYVKGHTLKQLIKRRGALPPKEAVWITKQLAGALLEAHKNGIIHRDIKSQNVLIKDDGTVKLADFGIAVLNNAMQLTSRGSVLGSVHYLAPELAKGGNATMQSDIYSLGIVLYELLVGDVPYKADTPIQVALLHVRNNVPSVRMFNPDIPQALENVIIKATARSTEDRYKNIAFFIKDLNACLSKDTANVSKLVLVNSNNTTYKNVDVVKASSAELKLEKENREKSNKRFNAILISVISIIIIIAVVAILFITGVIGKVGSKSIEVPDISGLTISEARDVLSEYGLSIDESNINWIYTADTPVNQIVNYSPGAGQKIEKGSKITVEVCEGNFSVMENYIGSDIEKTRSILKGKNINVVANPVESDKPSGTIITQDGLKQGDSYQPNANNTVTFTYSKYNQITISFDILGKSVDEIYNKYLSEGITVEKQIISYDSLNEIEKQYERNTVVKTSPEAGGLFTQGENEKIILYYYE